ncbi:hypothetical protein CDD80_6138 [Ophiocordyceps camponoti-rufipedis]|uniref:Uncharacterized protein n=1 Tax=Ophiocordyceps camponoti-rufipedis TaxID=2004952 RepID=A0A2C5YLA2_9HYPO|nr:hypothetical protein CDD80_6138 [Ophiocordyceps camponoti-rufipedis]
MTLVKPDAPKPPRNPRLEDFKESTTSCATQSTSATPRLYTKEADQNPYKEARLQLRQAELDYDSDSSSDETGEARAEAMRNEYKTARAAIKEAELIQISAALYTESEEADQAVTGAYENARAYYVEIQLPLYSRFLALLQDENHEKLKDAWKDCQYLGSRRWTEDKAVDAFIEAIRGRYEGFAMYYRMQVYDGDERKDLKFDKVLIHFRRMY